MKVTIGIACGIGKEQSEDTAFFGDDLCSEGFWQAESDTFRRMGVADGVGGNPGGRQASRYLARRILQADFTVMDHQHLQDYFSFLNQSLLMHALLNPGNEKMAATLTCVLLAADGYYLLHAGNTRLYTLQGQYLKQLTHDQTIRQWHIDRGDPDTATYCNPNAIYCCFGGGRETLAQNALLYKLWDEAIPGVLMLTSDGIHEYVNTDKLEQLLTGSPSDEDAVNSMIDAALAGGSRDDKTVIILRQ